MTTPDDVIFTGEFTGPLSRLVAVLGHVQRGAMSLHPQAGDGNDNKRAWSHGSYDNPAPRDGLLPSLN